MDFREICDFFGGTVFYDDLRGDLHEIRERLDRLHSESTIASIDHAATLILLRAVWNLLSGNFESASTLLKNLTDGKIYGPRWCFRGHAYTGLMLAWIEFPPLFKQCELSGPSLIAWRKRYPADRAKKEFQYCRSYITPTTLGTLCILDIFEFRILLEVNRFYSLTRGSALKLNPAFEGYEDYQSTREDSSGKVSGSQNELLKLRKLAENLKMVAVSAYLTRLMYETAHTAGFSEPLLHLESMKEYYTTLGDDTGIGLYWLIRGDYNASPPFTSPLVLNFDIADCPDEYGGDSTMLHPVQAGMYSSPITDRQVLASTTKVAAQLIGSDHHHSSSIAISNDTERDRNSSELSFSSADDRGLLKRMSAARDCYDKAEVHFGNAQSARGLAAVALRKACTLVMEDIQPYRNWKTAENAEEIEKLLDLSRENSRLSGDIQLEKLVQTHFLLADMANSSSDRSLGICAILSSNDLFGLCLGLFTFRVAQYFRYCCGSMTRAIASIEISLQFLRPMPGFRTLWFQVMLAEASISKSQGNLPWAKIWHGHLKETWFQLALELLGDQPEPKSKIDKLDVLVIDILQALTMRTVESIISVDIQLGDPSTFPPDSTQELLNLVARLTDDRTPRAQQWLSTQYLHIKYQKTIRLHKRYLQRGRLNEAITSLGAFLDDQDVSSRDDLQAHSYFIDVAVLCGEEKMARTVLSRIDDADLLPHQYMTVGRGFSIDTVREEKRRSLRSLEVIFLCSIRAGNWDRANRLLNSLESASPGFFTSKTSYTKLWPWQRCLYAGMVHEQGKQYNLAMLYFLQSWAFIKDSQLSIGSLEERRLLWDSPDVIRLVAALARRSVMWEIDQPGVTRIQPTKDPTIDTRMFTVFGIDFDYEETKHFNHFNDALLFLETGRAQHLWETSTLIGGITYETIEANYKYRMWIQLKIKDTRTEKEEEEFNQLDKEQEDFTKLLLSAWKDPEPDFSSPRWKPFPFPASEIFECIPPDAIVIYPTISDEGMILLAIDRTGILFGSFAAKITPRVLRTGILSYLDTLQAGKGNAESKTDSWGSILSGVFFNKSIERLIEARDHVVFVPSGDLMRLPLAALKFRGNYLILQKQVSQVPSLSVLRNLKRRCKTIKSTGISVIAQPGSLARAKPKQRRERALPMAGIEAKLIAMITGTKVSNAKDVSRKNFQDNLRNSTVLHICTHGYSDADFAMNSYISLHDQFRVIDMLAVRTSVQLVTFSACLSGTGHASESGDMQGFPHAMLEAGANAYIGALWNTNDVATMIHMFFFYQLLFAHLEVPSLAKAWQIATVLLYNLTIPQVIELLGQFVLLWDVWDERGEKPNDLVMNGKKKLMKVIEDLKTENGAKEIDFKNPYIWAPFVLVGDASTIVRSSRHAEFLKKMKELNIHK